MFRAWQNSLSLRVRVTPMGAVQVADVTSWDATRSGAAFVRAEGPFGRTVYLPASSVRGVMRSFSERLLLGLGLRACDPLAPNACGQTRDASQRRAYVEACFACRTFGSAHLAGRVVVSDFWPWNGDAEESVQRDECAVANRTERRGGIAIDRRTRAGALGHESEVEVVTRGSFYGVVTLTNHQLWQAALIGLALREIEQGYLTIGGGAGRGFGRVGCRVVGAEIRQPLVLRGAAANGEDTDAARKVIGAASKQSEGLSLPDGVSWQHDALADVATLSLKPWARLFERLVDGPWREFVASRERGHARVDGAAENAESGDASSGSADVSADEGAAPVVADRGDESDAANGEGAESDDAAGVGLVATAEADARSGAPSTAPEHG